jgi:hypothetical protein
VADVELKRRALSPERWALLRDYLAGLNLTPMRDEPENIKLSVMIDVEGITFLPAVYYPA